MLNSFEFMILTPRRSISVKEDSRIIRPSTFVEPEWILSNVKVTIIALTGMKLEKIRPLINFLLNN